MKSHLKIITLAGILFICLGMHSMIEQANLPQPIEFKIPKGWPKPPTDIFAKNKLTEQGFRLGKKLFYDARLSKDGEVSCASCHQYFAAFSTYEHDLSHGVNNSFTNRNAPALFNLAWRTSFHWDGGVNHIEVQALNPLTAPNEMGETLEAVLIKLKKDSTYRRLFKDAFGTDAISSQRMLKALAQFTGSLLSANSRYDKMKRGEIQFTLAEQKGYELYKLHCSGCHTEPLFTDESFRNNGMGLNRFNDAGRMNITHKSSDSLKFKVPSLRNVQLSPPYMHDGSIGYITKVLEHYRTGIDTTSAILDPLLKNKINLSNRQRDELLYFLFALTDTSFTKSKRFGPDEKYVFKH
ncbi:MAG: cytochrome-c peroxidase [Niastella sp. SCN 39-18]|nr:MAG: cytochrome-c peroxidase [Niastella sp. SCN 39-18]OJW11477.1 MAG: cytochrome-c peroxidase [Sphingobacteriales bacterium 39-19]